MSTGFRLGAVLRFRVRREEAGARALAEAVRGVEAVTRRLTSVRAEARAATALCNEAAVDGVPALQLRLLADEPAAYWRVAGRAAAELDVAQARAAAAHQALVKAAQDRRVLERLGSIQAAAARRRAGALAQREHDERAAAAHGRRRGGSRADGQGSA